MAEADSVEVAGQRFHVYRTSGTVIDAQRHVTTHVSGGGGYFTPEHGGSIAPVVSSNAIHDTLYIRDASQREHAVRVTDLQVDCRAGHELEFAGPLDGRNVAYLVVLNKTTGMLHSAPQQIAQFHQPSWWRVVGWASLLGGAIPYFVLQMLPGTGSKRHGLPEIMALVLGALILHRYLKGRTAIRQVNQGRFFGR